MTVEPRVEDLLATIRKAIDDDLGGVGSSTSGNSQGTLMRGALREMRVSYDGDREQADHEISRLRDRIGRNRIESAISTPKFAEKLRSDQVSRSRQADFTSILAGEVAIPPPPPTLRQTVHEDDEYAVAEPSYEQEARAQDQNDGDDYYEREPQPYYAPETYAPTPAQHQTLMSPQAAHTAQSSFQALTDNIMARALSETDLEGMARDILRPMLKNWLDDNLPQLVEKLVREEIERVARRGR